MITYSINHASTEALTTRRMIVVSASVLAWLIEYVIIHLIVSASVLAWLIEYVIIHLVVSASVQAWLIEYVIIHLVVPVLKH
jgi:hypothetical protein